eukprot:22001_1
MANKSFVNAGLIGEQPNYGAIRNRHVQYIQNSNSNLNLCQRNKWSCIRCGVIVLLLIILAAIFIGVFVKNAKQIMKPSIFGGVYSTAEEEQYNTINHYTNDLNCPDGYSSYKIGYFLACYRCGGVSLHLCLKDEIESDPREFFGGMYNTNECGKKQYTNPLTKTYGCDTENGYQKYLAIAAQTNNYCDTNIYVCLKGTVDYQNLGGFYTEYTTSNGCGNCRESNVNNAMINSLTCPDKYDKHLVAYTYSPGSAIECPGCNGRAYLCEMPMK